MPYIKSEKNAGTCFLCEARDGSDDAKNLIVYRGQHAFIILNRYPYNNGHLMVVSNAHVPDLESLSAAVLQEMMLLVNKSTAALRQISNPQGFNVGVNLGKAAGAGVDDHVHIHVVPRWVGDTSFMAVVGKTRTIPELLEETYRKLQGAFDQIDREQE